MSLHLTTEELDDVLIEHPGNTRVSAHLAGCDHCRQQLALLQTATEDFLHLGDRWAQVEAVRSVPVPSRWALRLGSRNLFALPLGAAAACVAVIGTATLWPMHTHRSVPTVASDPRPTAAQVAQDNQWLGAMDRDLASGAGPVIPASELFREQPRKGAHAGLALD